MDFTLELFLLSTGLFVGMVVCIEIGRRIGIRQISRDPEGARSGLGAVEGALFALLGLLIAFTFSGAASRFDTRRQLIVEETNAVGTAYLRLDLLQEEARDMLRQDFRRYAETRVEAYRKLPDLEAAHRGWKKAAAIQEEIWNRAIVACRDADSRSAPMLLLPALNQMIDITTTRSMALQTHPPAIIFVMLGMLSLVSAMVAGYGMTGGKTRSWIHIVGFSAMIAITIYVILDLEYPRWGLIQISAADKLLTDLLQAMK